MRPIETVPALFILALAAGVFFGTAGLNYWDGATPGARFFPAALALAGTVTALLLLMAPARKLERLDVEPLARVGAIRVGATLAALVALAAGVPVAGFVPMLALFVLAVLLLILRRPAVPSVAAALIVAGFVHIVFVRWLAVPLPMPLGL